MPESMLTFSILIVVEQPQQSKLDCRAASTIKARQQGISILEIVKRGCWSRKKMFTKFYDKDITNSNYNDFDYTSVVLSQI